MMKFSCEKALLQSAIAVTSRAVAQKSSIPALEGLLLRADTELTVSGYNLQTGIRTKVAADVTGQGELVLNAATPTLTSWASPPPTTRSCPWWRTTSPWLSSRRPCGP